MNIDTIIQILRNYTIGKKKKIITDDIEWLMNEFAYFLEDENPNFDEKEFRESIKKYT